MVASFLKEGERLRDDFSSHGHSSDNRPPGYAKVVHLHHSRNGVVPMSSKHIFGVGGAGCSDGLAETQRERVFDHWETKAPESDHLPWQITS